MGNRKIYKMFEEKLESEEYGEFADGLKDLCRFYFTKLKEDIDSRDKSDGGIKLESYTRKIKNYNDGFNSVLNKIRNKHVVILNEDEKTRLLEKTAYMDTFLFSILSLYSDKADVNKIITQSLIMSGVKPWK